MPHFQRSISAALFCLFVFSPALTAQTNHQSLRQGDRLYDKKDYRRAEQAYQKSQPAPLAAYNAGNAAYQQGKYAEAAEWFQKAAAVASTQAGKSDALYNLANAYLQQEKWAEAITAYQKSLRLQPNRPDAKKNLQIAQKKLREQHEPPPPPPPATPPPPPPPPPQRNYLDRPQAAARKDRPASNLTPAAARQLLAKTVEQEEQRSAQQYRELSPSNKPSRLKKDW